MGTSGTAAAGPLQPLADWPRAQRAAITGVFTDIDDTLTTHGAITPDALAALAALRAAGLHVFAITGRPVGWAEPRAREWPLDAVIAENGAVALVPPGRPSPHDDGMLRKLYQQDAATRAAEYARLQAVAQRVLREVPGAKLARDSGGRETDIAFDHAEFERLAPPTIDAIETVMRAEGLRTTRSSIHTHGAVSACDKWSGAVWAVRTLLGRSLPDELDRWVAIGDSGNDEAMFQHFRHSVGVANIAPVAPRLTYRPQWSTRAERGAGFAELAAALLQARNG